MSGGHFDYKQFAMKDIAEQIQEIISHNDEDWTDSDGWCQEAYKYPPQIIEKFVEAERAVHRAAAMVHRIDWLLSGDDSEETFLKRWEETKVDD